jgi:hypothetical protein
LVGVVIFVVFGVQVVVVIVRLMACVAVHLVACFYLEAMGVVSFVVVESIF